MLLFVSGCAAFLANTDVSMVNLRPVAVRGGEQSLEASFRIVNHNSTPSQLVGILYRMDLRGADGKWTEVAEGYSVQEVALPSGQPADVAFTLEGVADDAPSLDGLQKGAFRLVGELRVVGGLGEVQVPFDFSTTGTDGSQAPRR